MTYTQKTKTQWRRRMFPLSTKLYDEFKLVKTEYDATQVSASKMVQADAGTTGHRIYDGGPATCSSNTLSVNFGYTFSAAPKVFVQSADTSSITTAATIGTSSFIASSSGASNVFNWMAYGA